MSQATKALLPEEAGLTAGQRQFSGIMGKAITTIGVVYGTYHLIYLLNILQYFNIYLLDVTHMAISLGLMLVLAFLVVPAAKKSAANKLPWYDIVMALLSVVVMGYIAVQYERVLIRQFALASLPQIFLGITAIILILEATRRQIGYSMPVLAVLVMLYALFSEHLSGFLYLKSFSLSRVIGYMYLGPTGMLGIPMSVCATIIVAFIMFAQFLSDSGAGRFFNDIAFSLFGHVRGGPAKVAVVGSALFGTISGSPAANVGAVGVITIPMMKRIGYKPVFAGAVETVASTGGVIMPPVMGAVAFLIAEFLQIPYGKVCIYAALPAILYFFALFMMVDFEAAKNGLKGLHRSELPSLRSVLKKGWPSLIPLGVLLVLLLVLLYSAPKSAIYALFAVVVVSMFSKKTRMGPARIVRALEGAARAMMIVTMSCATAGMILGALVLTGIAVKLSITMTAIAGDSMLVLLVLAALASFILGMGVSSVATYLIVIAVVAPALLKFGIPPIVAHMFVFYWAMVSFFTPPVAPAAFPASAIAGASPLPIAWQATRLGIVALIVPFMFVYNPALLLIGEPAEVIIAVISSLVGVSALASGLGGYLFTELLWWEKFLLIVGSIFLIAAIWTVSLIGLSVMAIPVLRQIIVLRRGRRRHQDV